MTNEEINEAVARKLGYPIVSFGPVGPDGYEKKMIERPLYCGDEKTDTMLPCDIPNYCTDISAAWEIVEYVSRQFDIKSRFGGYGVSLEHHTENTEEKWVCTFPEIVACPPYEEMNADMSAEADTAPLAICQAFLNLPEQENK